MRREAVTRGGREPTRVLSFGCWESGPGYPRARTLVRALMEAGCEVVSCREEPPKMGCSKAATMRRPWRWPFYWARMRGVRSRLRERLRAMLREARPDVLLVPYPGHLAVHWARDLFAGPIVLDLFLSAHETVVEDRGLLREGSLGARLLARLDRHACAAADLVLLDTPDQAARTARATGLPLARFDWIPVSDPDEPEGPPPYRPPATDEPLRLLFFGNDVPLHGLHTLLDAVSRTRGVHLTLIGGAPADRARAASAPWATVEEIFVGPAALRRRVAGAHVVAGVFGTSGKADRVIPFKVVHALAAGRPVITADTAAVRRLLRPGHDCEVCPAGDPAALAARLEELRASPDRLQRLAPAARERYERTFSRAALARRLRRLLDALPERKSSVPAARMMESHA